MPNWRAAMDAFYANVVAQIAAKKKYGAAPYSRGLIPRTQLKAVSGNTDVVDRMADTGTGTGDHFFLNNPNETLVR